MENIFLKKKNFSCEWDHTQSTLTNCVTRVKCPNKHSFYVGLKYKRNFSIGELIFVLFAVDDPNG